MKKQVSIIFSESWLKLDIGSINELLTETINEFVEEDDKIINIEKQTDDSGLSRFWIYVESAEANVSGSGFKSDNKLFKIHKTKKLQIDVVGFVDDLSMFECKLIVDGRTGLFYMSKSNYEAFKFDGVFIRDGKEKNSANVINTTHVFEERC